MGTITADAKLLLDKIKEYKNIIIAKHIAPDWDAVGSAEGMRRIINNNFEGKNVFVVGNQVDVQELIDDEKLTDEIIASALLITVDTANVERLDFKRVNEVKETFRVDHHLNDVSYTDYEYIFSEAIACTQVVTLWAHEMNLTISRDAAEYLYRGLLTDSNRFAYKNTSVDSFEAAKILVATGIELSQITLDIYKRSLRQAKWSNEAFTRLKYDADTKFAYITGDYQDIERYNLNPEEFKSALGSMSGITEIDVWAFVYKIDEESDIKISLRSKKININKIAVKYGGGGHILASGGYLKSWDELDGFVDEIKEYIRKEIK